MPEATPAPEETAPRQHASAPSRRHAVSFAEALAYWFRLGCISFGGPAGQIAMMHEELVDRRRWISEQRFLHALNYCMVLPGPEAQQLATYIGWLLHGTLGGIVAGALFVLPSLAVLVALSAVYVLYGQVPVVAAVFAGVKPAVVAIVLAAVLRIGSRTVRTVPAALIAAAALVSLAFLHVPFPLIVLAAGVLGFAFARLGWPVSKGASGHGAATKQAAAPSVIDDHTDHSELADPRPPTLARSLRTLVIGLAFWVVPMGALLAREGARGTHAAMGWFFTKAALVTFGGAYAVLPYVADQGVNYFGWLNQNEMIDGLALGETTPGPLIMVVSFVGFVGGWHQPDGDLSAAASALAGCLTATWFTFLPSFLFILIGAPWIEQTRGSLRLNAVLAGITAAVVGVVLNLALFFGRAVLLTDEGGLAWFNVLLAMAAFVALYRFKIDVVRVVLAAGVVGLLKHAAQVALA
ncbi:MAG: chromate efflux transporter [Pirellulales bacterium]|nr:chromate efflux transporter [Pirellulales bacterium]